MPQFQPLALSFNSHQSITKSKILFLKLVVCFLSSVFCLLYLSGTADAGNSTVTVAWEPSTSQIDGYEISYGRSSGKYDYVVDVGRNTSCSVSGLEAGTTYYYAVKAYTSEGAKSPYSEELVHTPPLSKTITSGEVRLGHNRVQVNFNEVSGTVAVDSSGNGNDGTLSGSPVWTDGISGGALDFSGGADRVIVSDSSSLDISEQITVAAWVKPRKTGTQYVVKKARINATDGYELSLSGNGRAFVRFNQKSSGNTYRVDSQSFYPSDGNTWMHIAATYDGQEIKLYVDGLLEASSNAQGLVIATNNNELSIGAQDDGMYPFNGVIDQVHIYGYALTATDIQNLVDSEAGGNLTPVTAEDATFTSEDTPGRWQFNEGKGTVAVDSSGNGNDGALNGFPIWTDGISGSALNFSGGHDRVLVPDSSSLDISEQITIAAWVKPRRTGTQYVVKKARINATDGYELSLSGNGRVFVRFNQDSSGNTYRLDSQSFYPNDGNTWMHIAATYDGQQIRLYVDGLLETSSNAQGLVIAKNNNKLSIGAQDDGMYPFVGVIDQVHIYGYALTATDIHMIW